MTISGPLVEIAEVIANSWKYHHAGDISPKDIKNLDEDLEIFWTWVDSKSIRKLIREYLILKLLKEGP